MRIAPLVMVSVIAAPLFAHADAFRVANIAPGSDSSAPRHLTSFAGDLYFDAYDSTAGRELWKYDGTTATRMSDIDPDGWSIRWDGSGTKYRTFAEHDGALYFRAKSDTSSKDDVYRCDGTTTSLAADLPEMYMYYGPDYLTSYNNKLYFQAKDAANGTELWSYDSSTGSAVLDLRPGTESSDPSQMTVMNGALYFFGGSPTVGQTGSYIWKYDGTTAATVADLSGFSDLSYAGGTVVYKDNLYFWGGADGAANDIYRFDGTNVSLIADFEGDTIDPRSFVELDDQLYFQADDGTHGIELWKYDGSTVSLAADILSGADGSSPADLITLDDELYFFAYDGSGHDLWKYDGTEASRAAELGTFNDGYLARLAAHDGALYFAGYDEEAGIELWSYAPSVVPEPSTLLGLIGMGLTALALRRRRRRRTS